MTISKEVKESFFPVQSIKSEDLIKKASFLSNNEQTIYKNNNDNSISILNVCSNRYNLVQNELFVMPIFNHLQRHFNNNLTLNVKANNDQTQFSYTITINDNIFIGDEEFKLQLRLNNSYDNSSKQKISIEYHRKVCSNGLFSLSDDMHLVNKKHMGYVKSEDFDSIIKKIEDFSKSKDVELLMSQPVNELFLEDLTDNLKNTSYPKRLIKDAFNVARAETISTNTKLNKWLVYNGLNYQLNHADIKMNIEKKMKTDKEVLDLIIQ